ncbi:SDR family oxidoreductase [Chitinophaga rhizophila]|uniref:SDR family oxidoreductase n=1 Tax=Chitinophaga rhizophila TaxID=2866212 RepID=A0ABS7GBC8_9BACT|nr:SDR family oxidoreductase [Chitinophaga rhizophila]MBW8684994.1 SDR family oxidoreductase [Chitinophaga rhizophila]
MQYKNKVVWIIGASSGIGAALAKQFAQQQALLILTARNSDKLDILAKELKALTSCIVLPADITRRDTLHIIVEDSLRVYGHIDILVHSAGIGQRSLAIDTGISVYNQLMDVNFFGPLTITQYLLPHFQQRGAGHIVAVGSMSGLMGFPGRSGYVAAKHALKGYFETLQVEHTIPHFYITIVSPGRVNTPLPLSALTADGRPYNKMDHAQLNGIPVDVCAQKILSGITRKKKHIIIARKERWLYWLRLLLPATYYRMARKAGIQERDQEVL